MLVSLVTRVSWVGYIVPHKLTRLQLGGREMERFLPRVLLSLPPSLARLSLQYLCSLASCSSALYGGLFHTVNTSTHTRCTRSKRTTELLSARGRTVCFGGGVLCARAVGFSHLARAVKLVPGWTAASRIAERRVTKIGGLVKVQSLPRLR